MTIYSSDQIEEVWSWIHDERRCVTTQNVALTTGLSRTAASSLLQHLPSYKDNGAQYECTKCCLVQKDNTTVIRLAKSKVTSRDSIDAKDGPIYSLALVSTETLRAAHEKDMVLFRDMLRSNTDQVLDSKSPDIMPSVVDGIQRVDLQATRLQRGTVAAHGAPVAATTASKMQSMRKTTTAASFFHAKEISTVTSKKAKGTSDVAPAVSTRSPTSKTTESVSNKDASKPKPQPAASVEHLQDVDDETVDFSEKENQTNGSADSKKPLALGNADDFVGDEDEDEEFLVEEQQRKRRNAEREKVEEASSMRVSPTHSRCLVGDADDGDNEEAMPKVAGAMDAFATILKSPGEAEPATTHRKRRKRLVDKTTKDADGYLHTETIAVWEDVPTDEERDEAAASPEYQKKAPAKNTKNMKQGKLMGFFQKKK